MNQIVEVPAESAMLHTAACYAKIFLRYGAKKVYLFGSVAMTGAGRDLDFLVEVGWWVYRRYAKLAAILPDHYGDPEVLRKVRLGYIGAALRIPLTEIGYAHWPLDVHLVEKGWEQSFSKTRFAPVVLQARFFDPTANNFWFPLAAQCSACAAEQRCNIHSFPPFG